MTQRIPHADRASVDMRKLEEYCLSSAHPEGRHKARVFLSALGLGVRDAHTLRSALLAACLTHEAHTLRQDEYGIRYQIDFDMTHAGKRARIRSVWIARTHNPAPSLVTCYVL